MFLHSVGLKSDLIFNQFSGSVDVRDNYIKVCTATNPNYYWGNYLIFPHAPQIQDFEKWSSIFESEFNSLGGIKHKAFAWDVSESLPTNLEYFTERGYSLETLSVMTAQKLTSPKTINTEISIRKAESNQDWNDIINLQFLVDESNSESAAARLYLEKKYSDYRKMAEAGLGSWYCAFKGQKLVGDLGLFNDKKTGRFQNVETHPEFRNQGICKTLVTHSASEVLNENPNMTLVIQADVNEIAGKIYASLGFKETEKLQSLCLVS